MTAHDIHPAAQQTLQAIYSRRAVRVYRERPVDRSLIEQVVEAGKMAPSAMNNQPLKFYVLTNREHIHAFSVEIARASVRGLTRAGVQRIARSVVSAMLHPNDDRYFSNDDIIFHGAPVVIFITAPVAWEWAGLDTGACMQNMMLAAAALGLDSCPVGLAKFVQDTPVVSELHLETSERVMMALVLGYGDEKPLASERRTGTLTFLDPP
jgi:nitroreductase